MRTAPASALRWLLLALPALAASAAAAAQNDRLFSLPQIESAGVAATQSVGARSGEAPVFHGGATLRERHADIAFGLLDAARAAHATDPERGGSLELNLFEDVSFNAVALRAAPTSSGYSLAGRLEGVPGGTLTLVVNGDIVIGTVRAPPAIYAIETTDGGAARIREVDPSVLLPPGEPLPPQAPSGTSVEPEMGGSDAASGAVPADAAAVDEIATIDVLIVYTTAVREAVGGQLEAEALIDLKIAEANQAYADSGIYMRLFLTRAAEVEYQETGDSSTDLRRLRESDDGYVDIVHEWRDYTGSDVVHLLVKNSDVLGLATLLPVHPGYARQAFGLSLYNEGSTTMAHEIGHNMSLKHDRHVHPGTPSTDYSHGYVNQAGLDPNGDKSRRWRTIMTYNTQCSDKGFSCFRPLRFSNPDQTYEGDPLGVPVGTSETGPAGPADARRTLNEGRMTIAAYRSAYVDLVVVVRLSEVIFEPGQHVNIEARLSNRGAVDSPATRVTYYRSTFSDPGPADDVLGVVEFANVPSGTTAPRSIRTMVPSNPGIYYYGACVDRVEREENWGNNCSPGVRVEVVGKDPGGGDDGGGDDGGGDDGGGDDGGGDDGGGDDGGGDDGGGDDGGGDDGGGDDGGGDDGGGDDGGGDDGGGNNCGGSNNCPPHVEQVIAAQTLDAGHVHWFDLSRNFFDWEHVWELQPLTYIAESSDNSVVHAEIDSQGLLRLQGVARGRTAVTVTVVDHRDERVSQTFTVTVLGPFAMLLFPQASDPVLEGFMRVINHSAEAGEVLITARDSLGVLYRLVSVPIEAGETLHFNSNDLEQGNAEKGLSGGVGSGRSDWHLELDSELDIEALAYIRTADGFLTAMHDMAPVSANSHRVVIFNPGSNPNQQSHLRLVNLGSETARITVTGIDDAGASPGTPVSLTVPDGSSKTITAAQLEAGGEGIDGALGDGAGKWRLRVTSDQPIRVMNLLKSPTGHLTNLSTAPNRDREDARAREP